MTPDDNDKLWKLLGQTRPPEVSPFFARNVLRAVRQEEAARPHRSFFARFAQALRPFRHKALPSALVATCAAAVLLTVSPGLFTRHHHESEVQAEGVAKQIVGNPDYEVINHLDELVADEESSLWLDDNTHDSNVH
jgi:negative regulator of sigma E activity